MSQPEMGARRITNVWLIDHDCQPQRGDFILHADGSATQSKGDEDVLETIDGTNRLITRSFQNWHTHLCMILNRGMGEGLPLMEWLEQSIFPVERSITPELVSLGTRAAAAEMIATGTTFACDMYHFPESTASELAGAGLRGIVTGPTTEWPPAGDGSTDSGRVITELENLIRAGPIGPSGPSSTGRVQYGIATHAVYTCSEETLRRASELAKQTGAYLNIHTSETRKEVADCHEATGMYPVEYLDSLDFFTDGTTVCAHCGWLTKREMRILNGHDAHAVHCPTSNQKLACGGTMSYPAMEEAGVDVRLGTDGSASNNSLDMRAEAKAASMVQKHDHWNARVLGPEATWQLATKGSSDWVTWDLDDIRMAPIGRDGRRLLPNVLYSGGRVLDVFVEGEALRRDGITLTVDERAARDAINEAVIDYYANL